MRLFISTVSTSVITSFIRRNDIDFKAYDYANLSESDYKYDNLTKLNSIKEQIIVETQNWNIEDAKNASVELNGLLSFEEYLTGGF